MKEEQSEPIPAQDGAQVICKKNWMQNQVNRYKKFAQKASFTNPFIRKCINADPNKSLSENNICICCPITGKVITLESIRKIHPEQYDNFIKAFKAKQYYTSDNFPFRNNEATLSITISGEDLKAELRLKNRSGYGYSYSLINEKKFIGTYLFHH